MAPTLRRGRCAARPGAAGGYADGDVVVARFRSRPDLLVVKRAVREQDGGWWVRGDNDFVTDDSRAYGVADVIGRVFVPLLPATLPSRLISGNRSTPKSCGRDPG